MGAQIGALIVATSGVQLAAGFFGTFISLRVTLENFSAIAAALVLSSYFAGFTVGAAFCGRIIERVGHIRAYAAFGGLVVAATVAMPLLVKPLPWLVLRAIVGFGCAGLLKGNNHTTIGLVMLTAVLGGLAFQVPVGRLSDRLDRRMVLAGLCIGLVGAAIALVYLPRTLAAILPAAVLLGGFMSTLYPVCVAHAYDLMPADRAVPVSSRLILLSGLGSVCGPIIGVSLMERFGIDGVLYLLGAAALLLALIAASRGLTSATPRPLARPLEILTPQAAIVALDALSATPQSAEPPGR